MTERNDPDVGPDGVAVEGMVNKAGLASFGYFGNNPVQAGWNLRADQPAVGIEQSNGWIQRAVALVSLLRHRGRSHPAEHDQLGRRAARPFLHRPCLRNPGSSLLVLSHLLTNHLADRIKHGFLMYIVDQSIIDQCLVTAGSRLLDLTAKVFKHGIVQPDRDPRLSGLLL